MSIQKTIHKSCVRVNTFNIGAVNQGGMTLLIGLILLVMLTVISIIGFRNTTLSERMTGNSVDRNISFQSAENAGKEAISLIVAGTGGGAGQFNPGVTLGHYDSAIAGGGNSGHWTAGAGTTGAAASTCAVTAPFNWASCSAAVPTRYSGNSENAQFAIELLSSTTPSVPSGSVTATVSPTSIYRITSRSTGASGNAEVVLQTIYTR